MEESRVSGVDDPPILANVPAENLYHTLMVHVIINIFHEYCLLSCKIPLARGAKTRYNMVVAHIIAGPRISTQGTMLRQ